MVFHKCGIRRLYYLRELSTDVILNVINKRTFFHKSRKNNWILQYEFFGAWLNNICFCKLNRMIRIHKLRVYSRGELYYYDNLVHIDTWILRHRLGIQHFLIRGFFCDWMRPYNRWTSESKENTRKRLYHPLGE